MSIYLFIIEVIKHNTIRVHKMVLRIINTLYLLSIL